MVEALLAERSINRVAPGGAGVGRKHWLWRAVDQAGFVLDALVQTSRVRRAALRLMRKLLIRQGGSPRVLITEKLRSYPLAKREIVPGKSIARTRA